MMGGTIRMPRWWSFDITSVTSTIVLAKEMGIVEEYGSYTLRALLALPILPPSLVVVVGGCVLSS